VAVAVVPETKRGSHLDARPRGPVRAGHNGPVSLESCDLPADADDLGPRPSHWASALVADVTVVVVFALLGRVSHSEGSLVLATIGTAAPFMLGLLAGWLRAPCAGMPTAQRARTVRFGWWLLAWTMAGGVLLRWLTDEGLAPAFLAVATGVLAVGLVGRRWASQWWRRRAG
jgi:hypothetical protein